MIINGQEIEVYTLNDDGQEVDRAVDFGKNPDALPTENSEVGVKSGGVYTFTREQINANKVNRNLLDNAYFKIDQRQGYVVPPNTPFTTDGGQTYSEITNQYYTVTRLVRVGSDTVPYFIYNGNEVNAAGNTAVRGYVGSGMIRINDRYAMYTTPPDVGLILINDDGSITATHLSGTRDIVISQNAHDELKKEIRGKTVTLSVIANGDEYTRSWTIPESGAGSSGNIYPTNKSGTSYEIADGYCYYRFWLAPSGTLTVSAVKLEHGSISTLQAEMDSGAYDEDADLRECREYLRVDEAQSKVIGNLQTYSANGDFAGYIPSSIDMKGIPTLTFENCYFAVEGAAHYPITSLFSSSYGCGGKVTTSVPASTMGFLLIGDTGVTGRLIRSCEL